MDTFNFLVSILLMLMAIQGGQTWLALVILIISIITSKDFSTVAAFIIGTVVLYLIIGTDASDSIWPIAIFGLVILAILLGSKPAKEDQYGAGTGMDMFGGGGGY